MANATLIFDASPLNHFARAGALAVLRELVTDFECVTTKAVWGELAKGVDKHPALQHAIDLGWVATVPCDDLHVLYRFGEYMNRLGNLERNAGEASVLAWAEVNGATAYIDDQVGCTIGRQRGVVVHRTLHLVINAYRADIMTEPEARSLVQRLSDVDARFPSAAREDLFSWARSQDPPLL